MLSLSKHYISLALQAFVLIKSSLNPAHFHLMKITSVD